MAGRCLVLCDLLCFVTHFIRKRPVNIVKSLVSNFYEAKDVTAAKDILVENVAALEVEGWPRPVNRRDTPDKTKNEMNDIFGLLEWIDLKGLHERLPTYVSSNPEHLPPILLEKGDATVILSKMERLETLIDSMRMDMAENRRAIESMAKAKSSFGNPPLRRGGPLSDQRVVGGGGGGGAGSGGKAGADLGPAGVVGTEGGGGYPAWASSTAGRGEHSQPFNWAEQVSADHESAAAGGGAQRLTLPTMDTERYTTVYNDRHSAKRARQSDSPPTASADSRPTAAGVRAAPRAKAVGRMAVSGQAVKAAPPKPPKSVFHLSNVDKSIDEATMSDYLHKTMDITVLSIFAVKPAMRNLNSAAFRVCIPTSDKSKLLDTSLLPEGIIVRDWFFKGNSTASNGERVDSPPRPAPNMNLPRNLDQTDWPSLAPHTSNVARPNTPVGSAKVSLPAPNPLSMAVHTHDETRESVNTATIERAADGPTSIGGTGTSRSGSTANSIDTLPRQGGGGASACAVEVGSSGPTFSAKGPCSGSVGGVVEAVGVISEGVTEGMEFGGPVGVGEPQLSDILQETNIILHGNSND